MVLQLSLGKEVIGMLEGDRKEINLKDRNHKLATDDKGLVEQVFVHNKGTMFEPTGYAKQNRALVLELVRQGAKVKYTPCVIEGSSPIKLDPKEEALLKSLPNQSLPDKHIHLFNFIPAYLKPEPGQYNIGLTMFECNRLPIGWEEKCNQMDEIWVPSTFNYETFKNSGVSPEKLRIMPLGMDAKIFRPHSEKMEVPEKRKFAFTTVCSGWDPRKGIDTLISAFFEEFKEEEDVCLILKTRAANPQEMQEQKDKINEWALRISGTLRSSIILLTTSESWTDEKIAQLYNSSDCYVLPTHGEGWNMTAMEAMGCGLPVITTNWSAHLDFVKEETGYLINVSGYQPIKAFETQMEWAIPDKNHLKKLMRHVYQNQSEAKEKGKKARELVTTNYSWKKCVERMMERLQEILVINKK